MKDEGQSVEANRTQERIAPVRGKRESTNPPPGVSPPRLGAVRLILADLQ